MIIFEAIIMANVPHENAPIPMRNTRLSKGTATMDEMMTRCRKGRRVMM